MVDLDASAVLHDLGKLPEKEEPAGDDLGLAPQSVTMTMAQGRNLEELEESMRGALRPAQPTVERPFKQDSVTVRMFESHLPHHNRLEYNKHFNKCCYFFFYESSLAMNSKIKLINVS